MGGRGPIGSEVVDGGGGRLEANEGPGADTIAGETAELETTMTPITSQNTADGSSRGE
jgi:hypothetical protein